MTERQKTVVANWLLMVAIVCVLFGAFLWVKTTGDANAENDAQDTVVGIVGGTARHVDPNVTLPIILIGVGAFSLLSAVILFAGSRDEPRK